MRNLCRWYSKYWKNLSQRGFDTPRNKKAGHSATNLLLSFRQRSSFYFDKESFIFRARRQPRYGILSFRASDSEMRNPYKWCNFLFNFWIKLVLSFIFSIDESRGVGRTKKSRLIFMSLKTTKVAPPRKANRFTSALLLHPFFTTFLFSNLHKK